jgi:hypothetical protein
MKRALKPRNQKHFSILRYKKYAPSFARTVLNLSVGWRHGTTPLGKIMAWQEVQHERYIHSSVLLLGRPRGWFVGPKESNTMEYSSGVPLIVR